MGVRRAENRVREFGQRVVAGLGRQAWLDRPSYRFERGLSFVFAACGGARERVSNFLHGTWLGHPLHPLLTSVPIGAATATVALDAASVLPGQSSLRDASRFTLGLGILGSLGTAVTGMTDWQHTHEENRRVGLVHGALNATATALYVASWWDRRRSRHLRGVLRSGVGFGITICSGYLGGFLVYGSGTGVDQSGARLDTEKWTPVLPLAALQGGQPRRVEVDGLGLVLYRNGKEVVAVGELCPHLGAPMCDGWIDRGQIVCPWHGSRFTAGSGEVLRGPATARLPFYPTRLREGMIELRGAPAVVAAATGDVE